MATKAKTLKAVKTPARKEAFELEAPEAGTVLLAGDFTGWESTPIALKKGRDGRWKATVTLEPGTYQYRFMVDGAWVNDPVAQARVQNSFGTENCVREVSTN